MPHTYNVVCFLAEPHVDRGRSLCTLRFASMVSSLGEASVYSQESYKELKNKRESITACHLPFHKLYVSVTSQAHPKICILDISKNLDQLK